MIDKLHCPECEEHIDVHYGCTCLANWAAETVMGWIKASISWVEPGSGHVYITSAPWNMETPIIKKIKTVGELLETSSKFKLWTPQSDMNDAWMIHQKMLSFGFLHERNLYSQYLREYVSERELDPGDGLVAWTDVWLFVNPTLITKAAIKAVVTR